jgi:hypothetical protein
MSSLLRTQCDTGVSPVIFSLLLGALLFAPPPLSLQAQTPASNPSAVSDATVWGALVFASDQPGAAPDAAVTPSKAFSGIADRLAKVFPETDYVLLGQHTQEIFREYESWVVPSKELFLKIDSKGPAPAGGMQLHIQLWQETKVVVKTDAILKADSPLFIRGPEWRGGHLIFVVMLTAQKA